MTMHLLRGMTTINHGKTNYKLNAGQRKARDKALAEQRKLLKKVGINPDRRIDHGPASGNRSACRFRRASRR